MALSSLLLALFSLGASPGHPSLASILDCDLYRSCCAELATLPLLCSTYVGAESRQAAGLGVQPTHQLMDGPNCLLKAVTSSIDDHIVESIFRTRNPFSFFDTRFEDADLVAVVEHISGFVGRPLALKRERDRHASIILNVMRRSRPLSAMVHAGMSSSVLLVAGKVHVVFLQAMADVLPGWSDVTMADGFCTGFPVVGFIPTSGVPSYRPVPRPLSFPDIESLPNAAHNAALARRMETEFASGRNTHAQTLWDSTMNEVSKGFCMGPFLAVDLDARFGAHGLPDPNSWRSMRRFCVEQLKADGSIKGRCCDDASDSLHNECTSLGETITCDSADFPARVAAMFYHFIGRVSGWSMAGGTDDIEMAYRRCPVRTPQFVVAALVDPSTGQTRFFVLPGMAFGQTASVNQFNRLPELVVHFLRCRCGVSNTHYFDDYNVVEPDFAGSTGQDLLLLLHEGIGIPLSSEKHVPMSNFFVFLGVLTDFTRFAARRIISMRPKPGRLAATLASLAAVVAAGTISHGLAATLRGKLQFLLYTVGHGSRVGRSVLSAFASVRRGGRVGRHSIPIPRALLAAIAFLSVVISRMQPRIIDLPAMMIAALRGSVIVWSDAMWEDGSPGKPAVGGLGFVVWFPPGHPLAGPGGRFCFSSRYVGLSELTFLDRDHSLIGQLELLAAAAVYVSFPRAAFSDQDVIHYIDNSSALYGMVKGYSSVPDSLAIIRAFHAANLALRARVWFNYVATKANVADLPSRGALGEMAYCLRKILPSFSLLDDVVDFVIPACPRDLDGLWAAVLAQLPSSRPEAPRKQRSRRSGRRRAAPY
tara:strand:- start:363 stop:2816 length:2454 start_codon:yes stop_codon:yes gene_type:complete